MRIKIGNRIIEDGRRAFIIADIASAHEGSLEKAKRLVEASANTSVDAIKFQGFIVDKLLVKGHEDYEQFEKVELKEFEWKELLRFAKRFDVEIVAEVFDEGSLDLMHRLGVQAFKIHSTDLSNFYLLGQVARKNKPIFLAAGGSRLDEIQGAISYIRKQGEDRIILMHGFQAFPTRIEDTNLRFIKTLSNMFQVPIGFSDHSNPETKMSKIIPLLSLAFGASVLEKHITLDRSLKGIDYYSALNPSEFKEMIKEIREVEKAFGSFELHLSKDEIGYRNRMKKSIVARVDIPKGTIIKREMLAFKRGKPGLSPKEVEKIIEKRAIEEIEEDEPITFSKVKLRVGILVAVRMKSERLLGKALLKIEDRVALEHLIDRLKLVKLADSLVICTSTHPDDRVLIDLAKEKGIKWFAGSEEDVLDRFIRAAELEKADIVVRATGDNILVDPLHVDKLIKYHFKKQADYTYVEDLPIGVGVEVISLSALKKAHLLAEDPTYSEYMTWYLKNPKVFHIEVMKVKREFRRPTYRLTMDEPEDYRLLKEIFKRLYKQPCKVFTLREIIDLLDNNPQLLKINANIRPKEVGKEVNTRLMIM